MRKRVAEGGKHVVCHSKGICGIGFRRVVIKRDLLRTIYRQIFFKPRGERHIQFGVAFFDFGKNGFFVFRRFHLPTELRKRGREGRRQIFGIDHGRLRTSAEAVVHRAADERINTVNEQTGEQHGGENHAFVFEKPRKFLAHNRPDISHTISPLTER